MAFSLEDLDKKLQQYKRRYDQRNNEDKILYGDTSKKTKEFLASTKEMRLKIQKQIETLDDSNASGDLTKLTNCLESRIKQCDETLDNLVQLKDKILSKPVIDATTLKAMSIELRFPTGVENQNQNQFKALRDRPHANYQNSDFGFYNPIGSLNPFDEYNSNQNRSQISNYRQGQNYYNSTDNYSNMSIPTFERRPSLMHLFPEYEDPYDESKPRVTGFTKFCSNISELQTILNQNRLDRDKHMKKIEDFCKSRPNAAKCRRTTGAPSTSTCMYNASNEQGATSSGAPAPAKCNAKIALPTIQMGAPPPPASQPPSYDWGRCGGKPPIVHAICCGPSKVRPIFDAKIQKLEQLIVKYCFEIKEKNILIEQCCRSKEVLLFQKKTLHNVLLKLCEKIKQLEKKLHRIKMVICCPNMPVDECNLSVTCRQEIKNIQSLEDKLETLYNGLEHKKGLLNICKTAVKTLKNDNVEWENDIAEMNKIKDELEAQLKKMKDKVCIEKKSSSQKPKRGAVRKTSMMTDDTSTTVTMSLPSKVSDESESSQLEDDVESRQESRRMTFRSAKLSR